jgi:16S rRNA (guanine527-N7)-methyltransferase
VNTAEFQSRLLERGVAAGLRLGGPALSLLETYYHLLTHWNKRINLTSLRLEPMSDEGFDRLLIEPLAAAKYVTDSPLNWVDLGSGGGSPAFPLKIARPSAKLRLIETRSRKAAFLREVARELDFPDVEVMNERFEESSKRPEFSEIADLVTVRAVRVDTSLADATQRVLRFHGRLMLFTSRRQATNLTLAGLVQTLSARLIPHGSSNLIIFERNDVPQSK